MTSLEKILLSNGPMLSGELARRLSIDRRISVNAASQQVTRSASIPRINGFFKSSQSVCYLPSQIQDDSLVRFVVDAMYEHGRKYWYTINAIKMHGGVISRTFLECYTNYPVEPLKSHLPFDQVLSSFIRNHILVYNWDEYSFSPRFSSTITNPFFHRNIELLKHSVLENFRSLAKNTGLISFNSGELFAEFGKFRWGIKGVCPISGLQDKGRSAFLLGDVLLGRPFYERDVYFFVEKLRHVQSFQRASRIFPILLVDDLHRDALTYLKKNGIVIGFIKELFGEKYADVLRQLLDILNNAGASLKTNPNKYLDLIRELKKYNEGLANNIRGTLFEFLVGHMHNTNCQSLELGREVITDTGRHDMDVLAVYHDKVVIAECKARKSMVDDDMAIEWLNRKIPAFRSWLERQDTLKNKPQMFEYWSTSGFTEGAAKLLRDAVSAHRYTVAIFGPTELRKRAIEMKNKKLKESLDDYFLKPEV
ncbi:MAG TPA: hypothetical protein VFE32_02880 [Puia sp.]|jgi:hypothetical protein|nr:hypothetical protein [Puia sp.]